MALAMTHFGHASNNTTMVYARSIFHPDLKSLRIDLPYEEFAACYRDYASGMLIQVAFPMLSADEREFILTGITAEEWDRIFPDLDYRE